MKWKKVAKKTYMMYIQHSAYINAGGKLIV